MKSSHLQWFPSLSVSLGAATLLAACASVASSGAQRQGTAEAATEHDVHPEGGEDGLVRGGEGGEGPPRPRALL